jgi:hypothetical protein
VLWPSEQIKEATGNLTELATFAVAHPNDLSPRQLIFYQAFLHSICARGRPGDPDLEESILKTAPAIYRQLFGKTPRPLSSPSRQEPIRICEFALVPIEWQWFRSVNFRDWSIVKSQLVGFSRPFRPHALQFILAHFCEAGDSQGVLAVVRYATVKHIEMPLNITFVPQSAIIPVLKYLSIVDPQRARDIAHQYFHGQHPMDLVIAAIEADSNGYLASVTSLEKVHPHHFCILACAISCVHFDPPLLQETLLNLMKRQMSSKKLRYLLLAVVNYLSVTKSIAAPFVNRVLALITARNNEALIFQVARSLYLISYSLEAGAHVSHIISLIPTVAPASPEGVFLALAASRTTAREHFDLKQARECLSRRLPSLFCAGIRLLVRGLQPDISEARVKAMLRHSLSKLIEVFPSFVRLPSVAEASGTVWSTILKTSALKAFRHQVLTAFDAIMPGPASAAFIPMAQCVPDCLACALADKQLADLQRQILTMLPELLVSPTSVFLLKTYIRATIVRADKINGKEKSDFFVGVANSWAGKIVTDGYPVSEAIFEFFKYLHELCGLPAVIAFLKTKVLTGNTRFFAVFVAIVKFRKLLEQLPKSDFPRLAAELAEFGAGFSCRAHGTALILLSDPIKTVLALELSQFDGDCEETALLLRQEDGDFEAIEEPDPFDDARPSVGSIESLSAGDPDWAEPITPLPPSVLSDRTEAAPRLRPGMSVGLGDFEPIFDAHWVFGEGFEPITPGGHPREWLESIDDLGPLCAGLQSPDEDGGFERLPDPDGDFEPLEDLPQGSP